MDKLREKIFVKKIVGVFYPKNFFIEERGQAATEYLLLIAVSLAIILVGVGVALELKNLSDVMIARTRAQRNSTVSMLIR